ncbi:hypothetical protein BTR22_05880 [Alkalihalophilus pseudofirmus]|uniref:YhcN/YlaJ family sporulation lipoprotein n=2 Tax=Alkalihalophilus pseudofirmus TaxID=79885 RepID=A0AAJ2NLM3_ALKPS|nr:MULTISPECIES: YhcN/YlaJ family sporulation lipoprotein [Alkalihalophilus]MDV2884418.1 YhcN/YlaJ family sporulation lipoprotein [Alkalihalophilus pseudofirmus]MED1601817.1 YhcN/YlaJ family sporulation lipoprotein [Alkalihalophilus marmarensis]OLS38032.1 hypothetical protein BTR22_05880 [Alkalihalophilus pseudofirmus]
MKRIVVTMLFLIIMSGCSIEQKATLGANSHRDQGYSGYGVERARSFEGPLMDMMVPDAAPKGLTDSTARLTTHYDYVSGNRDLGMKHEGVNHMGRRIENSRPGILRDKVRYSNRTKRDMISGQSILTKQQGQDDLKQTLENLEEVNKVYMLSDDQTLVIGVAADNQNLKSLQDMIEGMAESYYPKHEIIVTSDRQFLRRMERLSHQ